MTTTPILDAVPAHHAAGILCFGGTFDPIHHGHLACSRAVAQRAGYQYVLLIPARRPPLRSPGTASVSDRMNMCRLATEGDELLRVSDIEAIRPGTSYTIETVRELKRQGWPQVHWLMGADQLMALPSWREPDALVTEARLVVMARPGWKIDWSALPPLVQGLRENVVEAPLVDLSATEIRRRVAAGEPIDGLTPPAVVRYIDERGLYRL